MKSFQNSIFFSILESVTKTLSHATTSIYNFKNGEKTKHPIIQPCLHELNKTFSMEDLVLKESLSSCVKVTSHTNHTLLTTTGAKLLHVVQTKRLFFNDNKALPNP